MATPMSKANPLTVVYPRPQVDSESKKFYGSKFLGDSYDYIQLILQCYLLSLNNTAYVCGSVIGALKPVVEKYNYNTTPKKLDSDANATAFSEALIADHDAKEPDPKKPPEDKPSSYLGAYLLHCGLLLGANTALSAISPTLGNVMTMALAGKYSNNLSQRAVRWLSAPPAKKKPFVLNAPQ